MNNDTRQHYIYMQPHRGWGNRKSAEGNVHFSNEDRTIDLMTPYSRLGHCTITSL